MEHGLMVDEPYSKVTRRVWADAKFRGLSAPKPNAQTLWLYLLTGKRCTSIPGLLPVGVMGIADDLDWPVAATKKCLAEIVAAGMARVDHVAKLIWLPNAVAKHNMPANPSVVIGWGVPWTGLPECPLRTEAAAAIRGMLAAEDARRAAVGKPAGLGAAFDVAVGTCSLTASGLRIGRPRRASAAPQETTGEPHGEHGNGDSEEHRGEQDREHGVPDGVRHRAEHGVSHHVHHTEKLQDQDQEQEQDSEHTQRGRERPDGSTDPDPAGTSPPSPIAAAIRSHRILLAAAETAPLGADEALARLVETIEGRQMASSKPVAWIEVAIADAARDLAAEATGTGTPTWAIAAKMVSKYADRARRPRDMEPDAPSSGAVDPEDERWTAERWREARRRKNLPDGEPHPRQIAELVAKAAKRCADAPPVKGWKPSPREAIAFWIRSYLDATQTKAGGIADENFPLGILVSRVNEAFHLPTRADVRRPTEGPAPIDAEAMRPLAPRPPSPPPEIFKGLADALAKGGADGDADAPLRLRATGSDP